MNKPLIKIIKRKDVEAWTNARSRSAEEAAAQQPVQLNKAKTERRLRREIVATISRWIPDCTKKNRSEEIEAVRQLFGGDPKLDRA